MYGAYEGDLVRPLGFVTLHAALAEGELDDLIAALPAREPYDNKRRRRTVGAKLRYAGHLVSALPSPVLADLQSLLVEAKVLFSRRNDLVHGRLFSGGRLVSSQVGTPDRQVTPEKIAQLAELVFDWKERLWACRQRKLAPLLATWQSSDDACRFWPAPGDAA